MGWLVAAGIVLLLAVLPLGVSAVYREDGARVWVIAGPIRLTVYPAKQKKEKKDEKEKPAEEKKKTSSSNASAQKKKEKGGSYRQFLPLLQTVLEFLGAFRRKLRVNRLELDLVLAGDDPCDLALNYGKAWAALGNLMPLLEQVFVIRKRSVQARCDFTADMTRIAARIDLTISLGRLLGLVCVYGVRLLRQYFAIMKTRKGGAKT